MNKIRDSLADEYSKSSAEPGLKAVRLEFRKMFRLIDRRLKKFRKSYEKRRNSLTENLSAAWGFLQRHELRQENSVLFIGYAEAALGLGEVFRNMLTALDSAGMPFAIYPFSKDVETRRIGPFLESRYDRHGVYDINVALMATDQLPYYFSELRKQVKGRSVQYFADLLGACGSSTCLAPFTGTDRRVVGAEFLRRKRVPADFRSEDHRGPGLRQRQS